jgi:hypothetical protein
MGMSRAVSRPRLSHICALSWCATSRASVFERNRKELPDFLIDEADVTDGVSCRRCVSRLRHYGQLSVDQARRVAELLGE